MPLCVVESLDHLVLTVADVRGSCEFYEKTLGMRAVGFDNGRWAPHFGSQKINLHQRGEEFSPHARHPLPGSADLCFLASTPVESIVEQLGCVGVPLELGLVERIGAAGRLRSVYFRDPDGNLVEIANQVPGVHNEVE